MLPSPSDTPYFWLSLVGAVLLSGCLGVALPALLLLITRHISWARHHPWGAVAAALAVVSMSYGGAFAFEVYCQWFGLTRHMEILLFACGAMLTGLIASGFVHYRKLEMVVAYSRLSEEQRLFDTVQDVSLSGFFLSRPSADDPSTWRVFAANKAACNALGYVFRSLRDNGLVGLTGADIVSPDQLDTARSNAAQPDRSVYMLQLIGSEGGRQWVEMAGQTIPNYKGNPVRVSYFNVVTPFIHELQAKKSEMMLDRSLATFTAHVNRLTDHAA